MTCCSFATLKQIGEHCHRKTCMEESLKERGVCADMLHARGFMRALYAEEHKCWCKRGVHCSVA